MRYGTLLKGALLVLLLASASACGVKNDLQTPDGQKTAHGQVNPSNPNSPIGQ